MEHGKDIRSAGEAGKDREFAAVLSHASQPEVPTGAMSRLMERIAIEPQEHTILVSLAQRPRRPVLFRLATALPLAASLALGVYLGASGSLDFLLPSVVTGGVALSDDRPDDLGGIGEADAYAEESLT